MRIFAKFDFFLEMIIYRCSELETRQKEIVTKRTFVSSFFSRGKKKKENSTIPRGRIIPPCDERTARFVRVYQSPCSTSTTIMVTPMLRAADNYYKKWRRTPGVSTWKLVSSLSIRIETSNLSDKWK